MNRDLLAYTRDARLVSLVVHEAVLEAAPPRLRTTASPDVPAAASLFHNPYVRHYWNASGELELSDSVDLKGRYGPVYPSEMWLRCGPDATWSGAGPPRPLLLMHQLRGLRSSQFPRLDSRVFAEKTLTLVTHFPPGGAPSPTEGSRSP
jgi:hypothetical protein